MAAIATFTKTGTKAATPAKLDKQIFGLKVESHDLIKAAYIAYLANGRENYAVTKTRGLVSGGGRKPWRQKGTGRARFGSTRNPIWRGGGIVFGPTGEENYGHKLHARAKRQALKQALSVAASSGKVIVIDDLQIKDNKTSEAAKLLQKIGATARTLIIVAAKQPEITRAVRNLPEVKIVQATYTNVYDVMNASHVIIESAALTTLSEWLGDK